MKKYLVTFFSLIAGIITFCNFPIAHAATQYQTNQTISGDCGQYCGLNGYGSGSLSIPLDFTFSHVIVYLKSTDGYSHSALLRFHYFDTTCGYGGEAYSPSQTVSSTTYSAFDFSFPSENSCLGSGGAAALNGVLDAKYLQYTYMQGTGINEATTSATDNDFSGNSYSGGNLPIMQFTDGTVTPTYRQLTANVSQGTNTTGTFNSGAPITISGNCSVSGAESNAIAIIEGVVNPDHTPTSTDYQYACDSTGKYSVNLSPPVGSHEYFVFYEQYAVNPTNTDFYNTTPIAQIVYPEDGWQFLAEYPNIANQSVRVQPASPFPFEWAYKMPTGTLPADVYFLLVSYADNTYTSPTFVYENSLSSLDPSGNHYFDDSHVNATSTVQYYSARLCLGTWNSSVPTLCQLGAFKNFAIVGESDSTLPPPTLPDGGSPCTNVLCTLFIPPQDFWTNFQTQTQSALQNTIPFYYFYQLKTSFTSISTTRQDGYFINTTLSLPGSSVAIPFQFFNTADPSIKGVFDDFRPYITAGLWLSFAMYLVTRAYSLLTPE